MEQPPIITDDQIIRAIASFNKLSAEVKGLVAQANDKYEYWDTVKYKSVPDGYSCNDLWTAVVADRLKADIIVWPEYGVHFGLTNRMQQQCHEFDMNFGGSWESATIIPDEHKERYLVSSLMEEAISSSQMEGAATTRKVAKEMLRKKIAPKDKSQQMIFNNYQTIRFITANKDKPLTKELLLQIHGLMTDSTLDDPANCGRFRQNDDVVVGDAISGQVVHTPPSHKDIPQFVDNLCSFFNSESQSQFIHPIIKGIIIHFMLAYMHPFVDGNGRTSRALFYWYMLKRGYWLTEYLSISRIIYRSKKSYEKSFLYAEADRNDIGYFISYNLRVLDLAFKDLQRYLKRKMQERQAAVTFLQVGNINERQAEIIKIFYDNPLEMLTVKDLQTRFLVTPTTVKSDIVGLVSMGVISEIALNKVKKGYIKGELFDDVVKKMKH